MSYSQGLGRGSTNYGDLDFARYLRRSFARSTCILPELLNKPVVGIAMTPSGFNNCHRYMPELVDAVSRGMLAAGALPLAFPTVSLGEMFLSPTNMMFRNLMAMDTEEMIRAQPMDAVVLIGGCDKTVPAQLMGAASSEQRDKSVAQHQQSKEKDHESLHQTARTRRIREIVVRRPDRSWQVRLHVSRPGAAHSWRTSCRYCRPFTD